MLDLMASMSCEVAVSSRSGLERPLRMLMAGKMVGIGRLAEQTIPNSPHRRTGPPAG